MANKGSSSTGLDLLLRLSLEALACEGNSVEVPDDLALPSFEFGDVGFVFNHHWRFINGLADLAHGGESHPGVCVDADAGCVAFGTSAVRDRDPDLPCHLLVDTCQSPVLRRPTLFLLKFRGPVHSHAIDYSLALPAPLNQNTRLILERKLKDMHTLALGPIPAP